MDSSLFRWIEEARQRGARTLHLAVGSAPRARIGEELHPLTLSEPGNRADAARATPGLLSPEAIESFVETIVPPRLRPLLDREGEGEYSFQPESGECLNACIYRCRGRWSVVVHLEKASAVLPASSSELIP